MALETLSKSSPATGLCTFRKELGASGPLVERCGHCGAKKGSPCNSSAADRALVTSYLRGEGRPQDAMLVRALMSLGVTSYDMDAR